MSYDAGSIESRLDVDLRPFKVGLDEAKSDARRFASERYTATVDVNTDTASAKVLAFRRDVQAAERDIDRLTVRASGGGSGGRFGVGIGGGGGGSRGGAGGFIRALPNPSLLALGIGAAAPLAGGAAGLAAGGAASFLTPTLAGGLGLAGFGAATKSSITTVQKDVTTLTGLVKRYNAATTDKQRAAVLKQEAALWASMDPQQRAAVKNVQALTSAWTTFKKQLEPQSFGALAGGAGLARTGLGLLLPSSRAAGNAVIGLEKTTTQDLQSRFSRQFFDKFLPAETTRAINAGGVALQNTFGALGHLAVQFAPLGHDLENFLVRVSGQFEKWSSGSGPARFVSWVEREGPLAAQALTALAHGLEGVGKGFGPIARIELQALTPTLEFLGKLGNEHPEVITAVGTALLTLGAGLKVVKGVGAVGSILGKIPGLGGGGGSGGGGGVAGRILGVAGAPGSSPAHPAYVVVLDPSGSGLPGPLGRGGKTAGEVGSAEETVATKGGKGIVTRIVTKVAPKLATRIAGGLAIADPATWALLTSGDSAQLPADQQTAALQALLANTATGADPALMMRYFGKHMIKGDSAALDRLAKNGPMVSWPAGTYHSGQLGNADDPSYIKPQAAAEYVLTHGNKGQVAALNELAKLYPKLGAAVAAAKKHIDAANDSINQEKSALAKLHAQLAMLDPAAKNAVSGLSNIPGAVAALKKKMSDGGLSIGQALADGITVGIKQNSGKVILQSIALVNGVLHVTRNQAQIGSPSKVTTRYGEQIAEGLAVGFGNQLPAVRVAFAHGTASALTAIRSRLDSARQQLGADQSAKSQFAAGLYGQYMGGLNLAGAVGPNGNVGNLTSYIGKYAVKLRTLTGDLSRLRKQGLSPAVLDMIAQLPPDQGVALATSILSGQSGSIRGVNKEYSSVAAYAHRAAGQDAAAQYGATIAKDDRMIELLTRLVSLAEKNPKALAGALDTAIRGAKVHR